MGTLYRTQILLEQEQHDALKEIAREEGLSISEVVRGLVRQYLIEQEQDTQRQRELQALENLADIRAQIREQHGVYQGDLLAQVRAERENDVERVWQGEE
jgi:metal-responsive CopG/Arc/MetJ family transcriptional regulator